MQNKKIHFPGSSGSIVVCICPLTALMMDQCKRFSEKGVVAKFVGEAMSDKNVMYRKFYYCA